MKKVIKVFFMTIFCFCLFSGCGRKAVEEQFAVYSFSGENDFFSISNGVIVLNSTEEIFYGGNLEEKDGMFSDIVGFSVTFYIQSGDEKRILLSNSVEDMTGEIINFTNEIGLGKVSGDIINETEIEELKNNLFLELSTTNLNGEENEYQLQLILTEVTTGEVNK